MPAEETHNEHMSTLVIDAKWTIASFHVEADDVKANESVIGGV